MSISKTRREVKKYLADLQPANPSDSSTDSSNAKTDKFLQPFTLSKDHNPTELRKWKKQVNEYFISGNMSKQPLSLQQAYLFRCLEDEIAERLQVLVNENMNIEDCLEKIEAIFKHCILSLPIDAFIK